MVKVKPDLELLPMVVGSKARKNGKAPIEFRITLNCKKTHYSIGKTVSPENWNEETKTVSDAELDFKVINRKIQKVLNDLEGIYDQLFFTFDKVTPEMIKKAYKGEDVSDKPQVVEVPSISLIEMFNDYFTKFEKLVKLEQRSRGTLRQWGATRKKATDFLFHLTQASDINFPQITPMFGEQMYEYLTLDIEEPLSDATAKKHIKKIKQFIRMAVKLQIIDSNPIADFQCGGDTNEVIPLDNEQIIAIVKKDFKIHRLQEVADAYIVQIFTGFAYQDLYDLRAENIRLVGQTNEPWLCKHRGKTGVYEVVPILPVVQEIFKKYKNHPTCIKRGTLLPILSNTHFNGYLKEIAAICGIERELHTHLARHTFADVMLNLGMPLEDVSKMLGHKSIRTTQRYCKIRLVRIQRNFNDIVRPVLSRLTALSVRDEQQVNINPDLHPKYLDDTYSAPSYSTNVTVSFNYTSKTG